MLQDVVDKSDIEQMAGSSVANTPDQNMQLLLMLISSTSFAGALRTKHWVIICGR